MGLEFRNHIPKNIGNRARVLKLVVKIHINSRIHKIYISTLSDNQFII